MRLFIRADSLPQMGTGHVMRCLGLAQACIDVGGRVMFGCADVSAALRVRLEAEDVEVQSLNVAAGGPEDAEQTTAAARAFDADWVVVDGYHFDAAYQRRVHHQRWGLLWVDDYGHARGYVADAVVNHNGYADRGLYGGRTDDTRLLCGPQYFLLRREFWSWRDWQRDIPSRPRRILVTMGGADPADASTRAIEALDSLEFDVAEVDVLVGPDNPHRQSLEQTAMASNQPVNLIGPLRDMPGLFARTDMVISAGGGTSFEMAFMGLPAVVVVIADNQRRSVRWLGEHGVCLSLSGPQQLATDRGREALKRLFTEPQLREHMSRAGRHLVDGRGPQRVLAFMEHDNHAHSVR